MKKIVLFSLISFIIFFAGCTIPTTFNAPQADDLYTSLSSEDVYNVMVETQERYGFKSVPELSVISTTNKDDIHHTILTYNIIDSSDFNTAMIEYAVFLSDDKNRLLNFEISKAISVWGNKLSKQEAHDIHFQNISQNSSLSFHYQQTSKGPIVTIAIEKKGVTKPDTSSEEYYYEHIVVEEGEGYVAKYKVEIKDINELQTLKLLLEKSLAF